MATAINGSGASPPAQSPIATFFPGYFALVMATGIVSLAAHFLGHEYLAQALFLLNVGAYAVLWAITAVRFLRYRAQLIYDLTHHTRGVTFLTKVAATCVLGTQFAVLTPFMSVAIGLWFVVGSRAGSSPPVLIPGRSERGNFPSSERIPGCA